MKTRNQERLLLALLVHAVLAMALLRAARAEQRACRLPDTDLKQQVIWGATCESPDGLALAFGGQDQKADDGQPHTRIKEGNRWRAICADLQARNPLQKFRARCWAIRDVQKKAAAQARFIFFQGLPAAEETNLVAAQLLPAQQEVGEELTALLADLQQAASGGNEYEAGQARFAAGQLQPARTQGKAIAAALATGVTAEAIGQMAAAQIATEKAAEALDAEPPPRTLSRIAYDAKTRLFVLFGGDHLDYLTNDTWVFDPVQRSWRQRHPAAAPPPRGNHALKAAGDGKVVLSGGYQYTSNTDYCGGQYRDIGDGPWIYDVQADAWSGDGKPQPPDSRIYRTGPFHPDFFLRGPRADAAATAAAILSVPVNIWVELKPPHRPELDRVWGTAVPDPDRDLILVWNGGHSSHGGSDVLHYHMATNRWELPFPVEFPLGQLYSNTSYPEGFNLNRRPWVTGHTYQSYGFDPVCKKLFFTGREWNCYVYDPQVGDWTERFPKPKGMAYDSSYYSLTLCATPRELFAWTAGGALFRLDAAAKRWSEVAIRGQELPPAVVDSSTMIYDSRRDRLLFFQTQYGKEYKGQVYQYDMASRTASVLSPKNMAALAALGMHEIDRGCYDPQTDLVLMSSLLPPAESKARRTLAYDCGGNRWVALQIKYQIEGENRPAIPHGGGHSCGMIYDAKRQVIWGVNTLERRIYVLRLAAKGPPQAQEIVMMPEEPRSNNRAVLESSHHAPRDEFHLAERDEYDCCDNYSFADPAQPLARAAIASAALILAGTRLEARGPAESAPSATPPWDARCVAVEVPREVLTDQVFTGKITVQNTGSAPWASIPYAGEPNPQPVLYSQDPEHNKTWGTDFVYVGQGKEIAPGKEFTFVSDFKAPSVPGEYGFQWRLARRSKDGATVFFGAATVRKMIRVRPRPEMPQPVRPARDAVGKKVLGIDDFQYVGSFRLPERVGEGGAGYSEIGIALRKMPDGTRRLLTNYTHPRQTLFEAEIPPLARFDGTDPKPLRLAEVKKVWGSLALDIPKIGDLERIGPNGGLCWDEDSKTLYWTFYHGYWTGRGFPLLSASRLEDDGKITSVGRWRLPQTVGKWKSYWGGVTKLPADFARSCTGGRTMALGFGGYYSICAGCSRGPALAAIARPDPRRDELDIAELLCYPDPAAAPRNGDYFYGLGNIWYDVPNGPNDGFWTMDDWCRSGLFIDLPEKHGYVAFVKLANGRIGYDYGAIGAAGASHWWYFYDPKDLGEAAKGLKKPGQILPHGMAKVSYPGQGEQALRQAQQQGAVHVGGIAGSATGACFDEQEKLLYVCKPCSIRVGMELHPCVNVYRVASAGQSPAAIRTQANVMVEIAFTADRDYRDAFHEVTLDALFETPQGQTLKVPAFWAGGRTWKVRYASPAIGTHRWRSACSVPADRGLHGLTGTVTVEAYRGENPLYRHGPLRVAADRRHFEHLDGTPFFWLADTWWMGLCQRLHWPAEFQQLAADRKAKGFNVVQIVAGLYPDMPAFDPRGANEAGFPWEKDYARIRPEYFDQSDRRLLYLVDQGFAPCIVGAWGYHLPWLGTERMKEHWRYLIARYAALPVVWCAAGEGTMPFYGSKRPGEDAALQKQGWTEVIRSIRSTDPFGRMITIHPSRSARETVADPALLDFDMHQTGHAPESAIGKMARQIRAAYAAQPAMPVIAGESSYDGLDLGEWGGGVLSSDASRQMFWVGLMHNGAAGGTYGANGIWQVNRRDAPYGPSPHGRTWGSIPWEDAMKRAGSTQVGLAKQFFAHYPWHRLESRPAAAAWADHQPITDDVRPCAVGTETKLLIVYVPRPRPIIVKQLAPQTAYAATLFDPVAGGHSSPGKIRADENGTWQGPSPDWKHDWVIVLEAVGE